MTTRMAQWFRESRFVIRPQLRELKYSLLVIRRNTLTFASLIFVVGLVLVAIFAPYLAPYSQDAMGAVNPARAFTPPSMSCLLYTSDAADE